MATYRHAGRFSPLVWAVVVATGLAFIVSLLASLNLYLLEDGSVLTQRAFSNSALLRFSYDGAYLSALAAGVASCAILGFLVTRHRSAVFIGVAIVALLTALGGFAGLLLRAPLSFLGLVLTYLIMLGASYGCWWLIAGRQNSSGETEGEQARALVAACTAVALLLVVNMVSIVTHTLVLNPVSHELFMLGRIGSSSFSSLLIGMAAQGAMTLVCLVAVVVGIRVMKR